MVNKPDSISDNLLVVKIRDGNKDAFKLLYDRYSKKIFYFSVKYLHCKEEAEELIQSVFIGIWEHRKSLDADMPVKNYIYRCAVNYIYNYLKKKAVRNRFIEHEMYNSSSHSDLTYEQVISHDLESSINSIVETLPPRQQKIFELHKAEGLTCAEIAKKLDLSIRTVENHFFRAMKIIRHNLKSEILPLILLILF